VFLSAVFVYNGSKVAAVVRAFVGFHIALHCISYLPHMIQDAVARGQQQPTGPVASDPTLVKEEVNR